jgi:hypothetical protein
VPSSSKLCFQRAGVWLTDSLKEAELPGERSQGGPWERGI